ncbi:hypothetical protein N7472_007160 [Penicillium cf. griseofulvum]|uniref:Uncharacterized protein n=1 Tax=Penicillium cf. griseofulvum TaxID=2972120 RepID=A0A9W9J5R6_9EURO|nr:hypothetical protein N7472_007160 [Penicillium cf. griseofulvum]KAJ5422907.1 hypothetical protein N7445_011015 [Penicillium cf. griseofulvum]
MPSQCVDGHRKPPKYLNENTKRTGRAGLHHDDTSQRQIQCGQEDIFNITKYKNEITQQEDSDEGQSRQQSRQHRQDPFDEVFDELIDSNFFYTEGSSFKFGNQAAGRTIVKGNNDSIPFFSNAGYSTWSERSSSVSEDSEVETSYQAPGDDVGDSLAKLQRYARDESYSGFAISSGWSSTFFPHGIEEHQHY